MPRTNRLARRLACGLERLEDRRLLAGGDLIGVAWDFEDSAVYRVDSSTGAAELIGYSGLSRLNSLAQDDQGTLYTVGALDAGAETVDVLATIDPLTGAASVIGPLTGPQRQHISGMAFSPDGILYARSQARIVTIDLVTAEVTVVSTPTSTDRVGSLTALDFGPDGLLYGWGIYNGMVDDVNGGLAILDPETGVIVDVDPNLGGPNVQSLVFLDDGTLFGYFDIPQVCNPMFPWCNEEVIDGLVRIDPLTGTTSLVGTNVEVAIRGLAIYQPPEIQVGIDVKPGSDEDRINLGTNGVIAVSILTTDDFDAATVDADTVSFAGADAVHSALEDVDGDGDLDMVLHFQVRHTNLADVYAALLAEDDGEGTRQTTAVSLSGETTGGEEIIGTDEVDLFFSGKALRELLDSLALAGIL